MPGNHGGNLIGSGKVTHRETDPCRIDTFMQELIVFLPCANFLWLAAGLYPMGVLGPCGVDKIKPDPAAGHMRRSEYAVKNGRGPLVVPGLRSTGSAPLNVNPVKRPLNGRPDNIGVVARAYIIASW